MTYPGRCGKCGGHGYLAISKRIVTTVCHDVGTLVDVQNRRVPFRFGGKLARLSVKPGFNAAEVQVNKRRRHSATPLLRERWEHSTENDR